MVKTCAWCGAELSVFQRSDARFCDAACRAYGYRRRHRYNRKAFVTTEEMTALGWRGEVIGGRPYWIRDCQQCGRPIVLGVDVDYERHTTTKFCSNACRQRAYRERGGES